MHFKIEINSKLVVRLVGIIILICAGSILYRYFFEESMANGSTHWPTTTGVIIDGPSYVFDGKHSDYVVFYVNYKYSVNGTEFQSNQVIPGNGRFRKINTAYKSYIEELRNNQKNLTVYYNPDHADYAVLRPGVEPCDNIALLLIGLFLIPMSFFFFLIGRTKKRRETSSSKQS